MAVEGEEREKRSYGELLLLLIGSQTKNVSEAENAIKTSARQSAPRHKHRPSTLCSVYCSTNVQLLCSKCSGRAELYFTNTDTMAEIPLDRAIVFLSSDKQRERSDGLAGLWRARRTSVLLIH